MKNFQQNLLIALACALCGLCAYQWYGQTRQRSQLERLGQLVYEKSTAIRDYTNSIMTLNHQIGQMDSEITGLRSTVASNAQTIVGQKKEITQLQTMSDSLTNAMSQYSNAVTIIEARLKTAYEGIQKQNESLKDLVAERDAIVKKLNDSVRDRNEIVNKYNDLARQVEKSQTKQ